MRKTNYFDPAWGSGIQPDRFEATIRYIEKSKNILDLGCGAGAYTKILNSQGYPAFGVDINQYPEWLEQESSYFFQGDSTQIPFKSKFFHTTILFEVLEHCPDPEKALREIHRCTTDYLVLSVPDCDLNNALRRYDLALAHWTDPTHCNFFTKETICELLESNGFAIIEISGCYKVDPNTYFWESIKLPKVVRKVAKKIFKALKITEMYCSSILVVARVVSGPTYE
jgi:SAM-dependent methyltransferase